MNVSQFGISTGIDANSKNDGIDENLYVGSSAQDPAVLSHPLLYYYTAAPAVQTCGHPALPMSNLGEEGDEEGLQVVVMQVCDT